MHPALNFYSTQNAKLTQMGPTRHFLALMAMARNECPSYAEWLAHHRREGVQHFYIIDNNSSVRCDNELQRRDDVTVWHWERRPSMERNATSNQAAAYNHYIPRVRSEWVAIWDVDEFVFGSSNTTTIGSVLAEQPRSVRQVCMPWLVFGSSGLVRQPSCMTAANTRRRSLSEWVGKCVQRTELIVDASIHRTVMANETYHRRNAGCVCGDGRRCSCCGHTGPSPSRACAQYGAPAALVRQKLRLHHYISQSREHMALKSAVGEADLAHRVRNEHYWNRIEAISNTLEDTSLATRAVCRLDPHGGGTNGGSDTS